MLLLACLLVSLLVNIVKSEDVFVDIAQGKLKGFTDTTVRYKKPFYNFKGIPYAEPRVGAEKFQSSIAAEQPWDGVWDATYHRSQCVNFNRVHKKIVGGDDCLYLNVYTPDLNSRADKPVIVFLIPGAFVSGSGDDELYAGDYLVEQDLIVVTFNHRVGATGFISTNDHIAPGNVGLKDQVLALEWVQSNIDKFGGSKDRVTLMGASAGAAAAHYHMLSPMSRGLFSKVAMTGGSALGSWALLPRDVRSRAFEFGEYFGITTTNSAQLLTKLAAIDTVDLLAATMEISKKYVAINGKLFMPVVELDFGQEIFIEENPWDLMICGAIVDVPVLMGMCRDEGRYLVPAFMAQEKRINEHFELMVPSTLDDSNATYIRGVADSMKKFYFNDKPISKDTEQELSIIITDVAFLYPIAFAARLLGSRLTSPVYSYQFTYDGAFGLLKHFVGILGGVQHLDDLFYMFYSKAGNNTYPLGSIEDKIINKFTKMLANFARDGNPTSKLDEDVNVEWIPQNKNNNYLIVDEKMTMQIGVFQERVNFWIEIFKDYLLDFSF